VKQLIDSIKERNVRALDYIIRKSRERKLKKDKIRNIWCSLIVLMTLFLLLASLIILTAKIGE
jgi:hypothetical protein